MNNNCIWYLRAETPEDKRNWVEVLESFKSDAIAQIKYLQNRENTGLIRHDSSVSLQSTTPSTVGRDLDRTNKNLKEKLNDIDTLKDILYNQINTLQRYFDACASKALPIDLGNGIKPIDFKSEAITFKATTAGLITNMQTCIDLMSQKDDALKRRLDKEIEKRMKLEDMLREINEELEKSKKLSILGPDLEVGYV